MFSVLETLTQVQWQWVYKDVWQISIISVQWPLANAVKRVSILALLPPDLTTDHMILCAAVQEYDFGKQGLYTVDVDIDDFNAAIILLLFMY